ncbi:MULTISPECIES: MFS transporter [Microbacterium]|uniref:MFS transporter n=1 Tax=Microbacterium TaxID=33882 RepID=UPI00300FDC21
MTTQTQNSRSVWREPGMPALIAMIVSGFTGYALLFPVAPLWAARGGADEFGVGLVTGIFMLCTVLAQLAVPRFLRRWGWKRVLIAGLVFLGLPAPFHLLSDGLAPILAIAALRGVGFAILTVCGSSAVAELIEPARRGRAIGAFGLGIAGPQVLVLPLAPWIAETLGFAAVFVASAVPLAGVVAAARLGARLEAIPPHPEPAHAHRGLRRFVGLVPPVLLLLGVTLAGGALITFVPQLTANAATTTLALLALTGLAALTRWGIGHIADWVGVRRLLWPFVLTTVGGLTLAAFAAAEPGRDAALAAGMALVGIGYGALQNLTMGAAFAAVAPRDQVVASAAWNIGFDAGTGLGAVVVGALAAAFAFPAALLAAAAFALLTLPCAFLVSRPPAP